MYSKTPDKPFKTYEQQIEYLKDYHGLDISNKEFALRVLKSISYYDLINGYKDGFMINDKFPPNTSIEYLYQFYMLDKKFQDLLFAQILLIETTFKTELAYILAKDFGVYELDYLAKKNFLPKHNKLYIDKVIHNITSIYNPSNNAPIPQPTKHYKDTHNHIPPWILFKNVTFSNSINLLQLMKPKQKSYIVNELLPTDRLIYKEKVNLLINGLNLMRNCRNYIAHNLKFTTFKDGRNSLNLNIKKFAPACLLSWNDLKKHHRGINDLYAVLVLVLTIIPHTNPEITQNFCSDLIRLSAPQTDNNSEYVKKTLFDQYADICNLPNDLPKRVIDYMNCLH